MMYKAFGHDPIVIPDYIYILGVNGSVDVEYGYFLNFDEAKKKAEEIAKEMGLNIYHVGRAPTVYYNQDMTKYVDIIKVDYHTIAQF